MVNQIHDWLVVTGTWLSFFHSVGNNHPNWRAHIFQRVGIPPTSYHWYSHNLYCKSIVSQHMFNKWISTIIPIYVSLVKFCTDPNCPTLPPVGPGPCPRLPAAGGDLCDGSGVPRGPSGSLGVPEICGVFVGSPVENQRGPIHQWENHRKTMGRWWNHRKTIGKP